MNKRLTEWFAIKNQTAQSADIFLYDEISPYVPGHNALDVSALLGNLKDVPTLNVRINSPGGSVFDGMAIYNALARHPGTVITHVDGIAASIASVIAMVGKEIHMADNSMIMIHDPSAFVFGDAAELRKQAGVLEQIKETIINVYVGRKKKSKPDEDTRDVIAKMMSDESWFTAEQAKDMGFATDITSAMKLAACDLSAFGYRKAPVSQPTSSSTPRSLLHRKLALIEKAQ
jgi:ATP-dependent protease ClpP protease subunit